MHVRGWILVIALGLVAPILLVVAPPLARGVSPDVILSMEADPATADPADLLTYTIFIDNRGPQVAPALWVNDPLPAGTVYVDDTAATDIPAPVFVGRSFAGNTVRLQFANFPAGNRSFQIRARVGLSVTDRQVLTNSALLWYTNSSGVAQPPAAASARTTVSIPVISVSKTGSFARLDEVHYAITIANPGSASARRLWWNDTLPPGLQYRGFLGPLQGASCTNENRFVNCTMVPTPAFPQTSKTWTINATIPSPLPPGSTIVNRVFVNSTDSDGTLLQEVNASSPLTISTSKITVFKLADSNRVPPGGTLGYTIFCNNTGQLDAAVVWINDTLPRNAGLPAVLVVSATPASTSTTDSVVQWKLSTRGSGFHSVTLIVKTLAALGDGTIVTNTATVTYTNANGNDRPGSRSNASTTVSVNAPAITAELVASRRAVEPGGSVGYTLFYNNTRLALAASVIVELFLPTGVPLSSASPVYSSAAAGRFTWNLTQVGAGEHAIRFTATVPTDTPLGSILHTPAFANYTDDRGNRIGGSQTSADVAVQLPASGAPWAVIGGAIAAAAILGLIALRTYLSAIEKTVIDEVFLLHRDGLLVKHYTRRLKPDADSDILSGMLIAVQNFVNESFIGESGLNKEGQLDEMKFGQYRILLVRGEYVIVGAVVSGPRVDKVPAQIRGAIDDLERELGPVLERWDGNMDQVSHADGYMQDLIAGRYRNLSKLRRGNH